MTKEEQNRDKYYQKKYGITLADYNQMLVDQQERCAICNKHQSEFKNRLHVDHDHAWKKVRIDFSKGPHDLWNANAYYRGLGFFTCSATKIGARNLMKLELKKSSVRGLLCWQDNTGLQKFRDNSERMEAAAQYLRRFSGKVD